MEVLTQVLGTDTWMRWPTVLRGLLAAFDEPARCVVLHTTAPQEERDQLVEAALLLHRVAGRAFPVVVAGPPAPGSWRDEVRMAGVTRIWVVRRAVPVAPGRVRLELQDSVAVSGSPRPARSPPGEPV